MKNETKHCENMLKQTKIIKVGPSPSNTFFVCFNESPLKMMKNAFYFILKALFVLKLCKFCLDFLVM